MTFNEVKQFLNRGYKIYVRIKAKEERIRYWNEYATSTTAALKPVYVKGSSMPTSKVEKAVLSICELQDKIQAEIDSLTTIEHEVAYVIEHGGLDPVDKAILELRYQNFKDWDEIARELNYAYRWILRRHKRAIFKLMENWPLKVT